MSTVIAIFMTVAALYFAQEVLIPLALAVMLSFLLAPPATWLERHRLGRVPSVVIVVLIAALSIVSLGYVVGRQVYSLAESLPNYTDEIKDKVQTLRGSGGGLGSILSRFSSEIKEAATEATTQPAGSADGAATQPTTGSTTTPASTSERPRSTVAAAAQDVAEDPIGTIARERVGGPPDPGTAASTQPAGLTPANPIYSVALPAPTSPIQLLGEYVGVILGPLGTAGLVGVFVIFMLLEREALRDRLIRLVSRGKYTVTTKAINDAAHRISRYVLAQSIVNGTYGLIIALGLWIIGMTFGNGQGFPSFVLWGLLCAVLRFIPYVGPWVAAAFPIALSLAVFEGFNVTLAVIAMFVVVELFSNNAMEPWLYGTSTGMSTIAIIVAAVFWTWLWGPIGLLLSTPMTVCIVVIGKYVAQLHFFDVLLSDQAALPPAVSYYQRLLAGDWREAGDVAREVVREKGREQMPDEVFLPALQLTRRDREAEDLTAEQETTIYQTTAQVVDDTLRPPEPNKVVNEQAAGIPDATSPPTEADVAPLAVLGCPAHHRAEELVLQMLARMLGPSAGRFEIASTRLLPSEVQARLCRDRPALVFIAILPPGGVIQARFLVRRLRKAAPEAKIIVGYFGRVRDFDRLLNRLRSAGANTVTTSMLQSYRQLQTMLGVTDAAASTPAGT